MSLELQQRWNFLVQSQLSVFCCKFPKRPFEEHRFIISPQPDVIRENHTCDLSASRTLEESVKWDDKSCLSRRRFLLLSAGILTFGQPVAGHHALLFLAMLEFLWPFCPFVGFHGLWFIKPPVLFFFFFYFRYGFYTGKRNFIVVCLNGPREMNV